MIDDVFASGSKRAAYAVDAWGVFDVERDDAPVAILPNHKACVDFMSTIWTGIRTVIRPVRIARLSWEVENGTHKE